MKLINGDCLEVMKGMAENSIDMILTSPPYDNLRTYHGYTCNFEGIAKELYRVLKDGGVVVWVVGDATIKGSETGTSFKQAFDEATVGEIVEEFDLKFSTIVSENEDGTTTRKGVSPEMLDYLRTILAQKDAEIQKAYTQGRIDEAKTCAGCQKNNSQPLPPEQK